MDKSTVRWHNVPPPSPGSQVSVMGTTYNVTANSTLAINIQNHQSQPTPTPHLSPQTDPSCGSGRKHQIFVAHPPPRLAVLCNDATESSATAFAPTHSSSCDTCSCSAQLQTIRCSQGALPLYLHKDCLLALSVCRSLLRRIRRCLDHPSSSTASVQDVLGTRSDVPGPSVRAKGKWTRRAN
jgi:hypothetical protein